MSKWYRRVFQETDPTQQLVIICQACEQYEAEFEQANSAIRPKGRLTEIESKIPGLAAENMARIGDLNIIIKHLENMEAVAKKERTVYYMEHYQRKLSETIAGKYAEADDQVQSIRLIRYRVGSVASQFDAISRGLEYMHFQLSNITKLKCAGLDDAEI
jgi:hypothetical protein